MKAKTSIGGDRDAMLELVSDMMEKDLILVGATAVEDKLQPGVLLSFHENYFLLLSLSFYCSFSLLCLFYCVGASMYR